MLQQSLDCNPFSQLTTNVTVERL